MKQAILGIAAGAVVMAAMPARAALIEVESANSDSIAVALIAGDASAGTNIAGYAVGGDRYPVPDNAQRRYVEHGHDEDAAAGGGRLPEPASWAMMLLGFSALGFTLRRRAAPGTRIRFN